MTITEDRAKYAKQFFIGKGWTPTQADGIVGNLMQESGFRNDVLSGKIYGDSGKSGYVAQWNGQRLKNLFHFAGTENPSFDQQLGFVHHELTQGDERSTGQKLAKANDLYSATAAAIGYERPSGYSPATPERGNGWANRLKYATESAQNTLTGPANQDLSGVPPHARNAVQNALGITADRGNAYTAPPHVGYGPSTIIGGISNEPMYTARRGNSLVDVNDDEYWKSVAPETVVKAAPAAAPVASAVPLGRPAGPLDAPVTENGAAGAAAPATRPAGPLDQPSTENSPTDPAPVTGDTSLQGSAGSNTLAGGTPRTPRRMT
jgi:hypothetical protein